MLALLSNVWVIQIAVFLAVACGGYVCTRLMASDQRRMAARFRAVAGAPVTTDSRYGPSYSGVLALLKPLQVPLTNYLIPNDAESRSRLQGAFYRAGIFSNSAISVYAIAKMGLTLVLPVLAWSVLHRFFSPTFALGCSAAAGMIGMLLPSLWLQDRIGRRQRVLRKSLPDFLDLLLACVEGGMGIQAAMAEVARELAIAHTSLASEFDVVQREMELGRSIDTALQNLVERTGVDELRSLATFVQQSQRFGSTISEALRQLSDMLRTQREHRAEELAHKAAVKVLIPTLLLIFPTVFVVLAGPAAIQIYRSLLR